ncbi:MAG: hypothetical protein IJI49_00705 [Bacilli bacterium]|nr:hypothetical protein [Bacilli bacterium]
MIELIDIDGNIKFMATIITGINYGNNLYVLYSIKRDNDTDNLFISKIVKNSYGYVMDNNFSPGEKEAMDDVVNSILNKDSLDKLKESGVSFSDDIVFDDINRFSVTNCYVTTFNKDLIEECINFYNFKVNTSKSTVVVKEKSVSYFSKNNRPSIYLIIVGIIVIVLSIILIINLK